MYSGFHINVGLDFEAIESELNSMKMSLLGVEEVDFCNMPESLSDLIQLILKSEENDTLDFFEEMVLLVADKEEQMKLICVFQTYRDNFNKGVLSENKFLIKNSLNKKLHNEWVQLHKKLMNIFKTLEFENFKTSI